MPKKLLSQTLESNFNSLAYVLYQLIQFNATTITAVIFITYSY
jgi:hypothetical protein